MAPMERPAKGALAGAAGLAGAGAWALERHRARLPEAIERRGRIQEAIARRGYRQRIMADPAHLPDLVEVVELPETGHMAPLERPEQVNYWLRRLAARAHDTAAEASPMRASAMQASPTQASATQAPGESRAA